MTQNGWAAYLRAVARRACVLSVVAALFAATVFAQTNDGQISGSVLDATGAVVPSVTITAKNIATGTTATTTSTGDGNYRFPALQPGQYNVTATSPGFGTVTQSNVEVFIAKVTSLDFNLQVGEASQTVTVSSEGTTIQAETSEVSTQVSSRQVIELPLALGGVGAMRSPEAFVFLTPGAVGPGTANSNNGIFLSKIGAGQNFGNEVLLDGQSTLRNENGSSFDEAAPSVEAIREFTVLTSTFPAQYDRTTGGVETFTTKSGANQFHGTVFDIFRNEALNANTWFNNRNLANLAPGDPNRENFQRPKDKQNDYGLNLGGPVWIPKIYNGRDRTFFFFNWEQYRRSAGGTQYSTVPTLAQRNGDFSADLNTATVLGTNPCDGTPIYAGQIFDPATQRIGANGTPCRTAFPGNVVPANRISQISKNFLAYLPAPNTTGSSNFAFAGGSAVYNTTPLIRIDHNFSDRARIFAMYHSRENTRYIGDSRAYPAPADSNGWNQDFITHYSRVGFNYTLSPTIVNQLLVGYNRTNSQNFTDGSLQAQAENIDWPSKFGITGISGTNFPIVNFGSSNVRQLGRANQDVNIDNGWRFNDNFNWIKGKHNLVFGFDARNQLYSTFGYDTDSGVYNFRSDQTAAIPTLNGRTGSGIASFLLGEVGDGNTTVRSHIGRWTQQYYAVFAQDDFKLRPNLTLNLGLRWNLEVPRREGFDNTSNFSPTTPNPGAGGRPGALIFGSTCKPGCDPRWADIDYHLFAPRVGFAWTPGMLGGKSVIRGGYGIFYAPMQYTDFGGGQQQGYSSTPDFFNPDNFTAGFNWNNGFPAFARPPFLDPTLLNGNGHPDYIKPEYGRTGMVQSWSLQVQQQVATDMIATVGYVGQRSVRLRAYLDTINNISPQYLALGTALNQPITNNTAGIGLPYAGFTGNVAQALRPFPQYNGYIGTGILENLGQASYHSLQATLQRRFAAGLSLQTSFTWQKTITNADSILPGINAGGGSIQNPFNLKSEKAISSQDVPLVFTAAWLYELPFGRGKPLFPSGVAGAVLGGWQLGGLNRYQSGAPFTFGCATGIPGIDTCIRFDRVAGQNILSQAVLNSTFDPLGPRNAQGTGTGNYLNPAAFSDPNANLAPGQPYRFGNLGRVIGSVRTKPFLNEDFSIIRNFRVVETVTVQFKAELLNAFNRHIFSPPNTAPNDVNFGLVTGTINNPRNVQFTLRVNF